MARAPPARARHRLRRTLRLSRPCNTPLHASRNLRAALLIRLRGRRGKSCAAIKVKRSTPCRQSGSGRRRKGANSDGCIPNQCDVRSDEQLSCIDKTRCSVSGSLPARARLATVGCEAAGTRSPAERLSRTVRGDDDGESHAIRERGSEGMVNASELLINAVIDDKPLSDTVGLGQKAWRKAVPLDCTGHTDNEPLGGKAGPNPSNGAHSEHGKPASSLTMVVGRPTVRKR